MEGGRLVRDPGQQDACQAVEQLRPDERKCLMHAHPESDHASRRRVRADRLEASTSDRLLRQHRNNDQGCDGEERGVRNAHGRSARNRGEQRGRTAGRPARDREDSAVQQSVHSESGDDGVETKPADQQAVDETGTDGERDGHEHSGSELAAVARRLVGGDHHCERDPPRDGQVDSTLLHDGNWPSPAIAKTAANGTMPMIALCETLDGAITPPTTKSATVAMAMAMNPRATRNREVVSRVVSRIFTSITIAPAGRGPHD